MRRSGTGFLLILACVVSLSSCSSGSEEPPKSATCDVAQSAVDEAQRQAEIAITAIADDPTTAQETLTGVGSALATAEDAVSDDERVQLQRAHQAADRLLTQARQSAKGNPVEGEVVTQARADLLDVVGVVRAAC